MDYSIIKGVIIGATAQAVLLKTTDPWEPSWVPRSVCLDGDKIKTGDVNPSILDWFIEKEEL